MPADPLKIFFPGKLVFGNGTLTQLADDVIQLKPGKVFIATISPLINFIGDFTTALKQRKSCLTFNKKSIKASFFR